MLAVHQSSHGESRDETVGDAFGRASPSGYFYLVEAEVNSSLRSF